MAVDELLSKEFEEAGYGGITLTKTPLGAQINLYTMRPGRVIGKQRSVHERLLRYHANHADQLGSRHAVGDCL
jgi:small subunit ribosomal protein S3